jgi:excinuclease ABC subunit A
VHEDIDRVLEVDPSRNGKTRRSCPAMYIGFCDTTRRLFTETRGAKAHGYASAHFSFNTGAAPARVVKCRA